MPKIISFKVEFKLQIELNLSSKSQRQLTA